MTTILALPLLPAAIATCLVATATVLSPILAMGVAIAIAAACGVLAVASADRGRRLLWAAAGAAAATVGVRAIGAPLPFFDLRDVPLLGAIRSALGTPLARLLPEPEAGLALGIVLGERASVGPALKAAFNATGTTHLLAISGYNLTLVAAVVALVTGRLRPASRAALALGAVLAYSLIVGLEPSVVRAALMAAVAALAVATGRRGTAANALAAAVVLMLAIDPSAIGQAGFLLSVAATAGLIAFQKSIAVRLSWLPGFLAEGLAATLAATLPTLPLIAAIFGRISLVSPVANLVAVPLFAPLLGAGAITGIVGAFSIDAARPFALATYVCAAALRIAVETFATVPGASVDVPDGAAIGIGLGLLTTGAVLLARARRLLPDLPLHTLALARGGIGLLRRALAPSGFWPERPASRSSGYGRSAAGASWSARAVVAAVLTIVIVIGVTRLAPAEPLVRVLALDVGQGDAYLVQVDGAIALIDGGPDPSRLLTELGTVLPPWRRRIDLIVLTHAHLDHGAGLLAVLGRYTVGLAVEPSGLNDGPLATEWSARLAAAGVPRRAIHVGDRIRLGLAAFNVLSPDERNERVDVPSLVLRLERARFTMLFCGDATDAAQADLLLLPGSLVSRVYVPPHHGAQTPHAVALVRAVQPEVAVLSVGAQNRYGHPAPETLAALGAVPAYRTDKHGTVEITSDGSAISVRTHANGLPPPRRGFVPYAPPAR